MSILLPAGALADSLDEAGMELTTPVRHQLRLLNDAWQSWIRAYDQADPEAAETAMERLQAITGHLGMSRLPDLSTAAATFAVISARDGDLERARWVLACARRLDSERPETDFADSAIRRLEGDWAGAVASGLRGYLHLLRLPLERELWLHSVGLWLLLALIVSGGVFVALGLATRGAALYDELVQRISPPLPRPVADLAVIVALLWPLFLPSGVLWLALYWSILLWGYGSLSEKLVFLALWLILAATPLVLSYQQRSVQLALMPSARAVDNLAAGRLYGALFSDLSVLRALLPESPAVLELVGDLHRRYDQWEYARSIYGTLVQDVEQDAVFTAAPLSNIGLYHLRRKDYGTALSYFQRATEADPGSPAAFYNLSRAYAQRYEFSQSNDALERAKQLDRDRVESWADAESPVEESGVGIDGGLRRVPEIRRELRSTWRGVKRPATLLDLWLRHLSFSIIAATILLAVTLQWVMRQPGSGADFPEPPWVSKSRWLRALVPGLTSVSRRRGGRAILAILLPVAVATWPLVRAFGYRPPLGYDPGTWLPTLACTAALAFLFLVRLGWEHFGADR